MSGRAADAFEGKSARAADLRVSLEQLRAELNEAVEESLRKSPAVSAFKDIAGKPQRLRAKIRKAEAELESLDEELPALAKIAAEEAQQQARERAEAALADVAALRAKEAELAAALRQWHNAGVEMYVTMAPALLAERDRLSFEGRKAAEAAGMAARFDAEFAKPAEGFEPRSFTDDGGVPKNFAATTELLNETFHIRGYEGAGVDVIREQPTLIRKTSLLDQGPTHEERKPPVYQWVDQESCQTVEEPAAGGGTRKVVLIETAKVRLDHPPHPDWMYDDRWRRVEKTAA